MVRSKSGIHSPVEVGTFFFPIIYKVFIHLRWGRISSINNSNGPWDPFEDVFPSEHVSLPDGPKPNPEMGTFRKKTFFLVFFFNGGNPIEGKGSKSKPWCGWGKSMY